MNGKRGVKVHLEDEGSKVRLVFDDVVQHADEQTWTVDCFFTETYLDKKRLPELEFTEKELADIGLAILARLCGDFVRGE
jgi:hypothetical protein